MKLADYPPEVLERLREMRYDRIIEKHEGPERWEVLLGAWPDYRAEVTEIQGYQVLLPIPVEHHAHLAALRVIPSADAQSLTLILADHTFDEELLLAGRLAVCDKLPGTDLYVAVAYHEMFLDDTVLWHREE